LRVCASVLGIRIGRTVADEGSAFGAALLGGVAGGVFADVHDAVSRVVRTVSVVEPNPAWRDVYAELQPRYDALYPALRDLPAGTVAR
jgi:xylulokinase